MTRPVLSVVEKSRTKVVEFYSILPDCSLDLYVECCGKRFIELSGLGKKVFAYVLQVEFKEEAPWHQIYRIDHELCVFHVYLRSILNLSLFIMRSVEEGKL